MGKKILENLNIGCSWTSYISSAYGVLKGAGYFEDDLYKLAGMSGIAFHFIVHKTGCPSAVTVYDWVNEHFLMMDRIGAVSEVTQVWYDPKLNTFKEKQQEALQKIKESIDRGVGVVIWTPTPLLEFGIVRGYDDEDGVLFVQECTGNKNDPLLYANLGKSDVSVLFYQIFKGKVQVYSEKVYKESLRFGLSEWKKEHHINPDYASGSRGYDNLISTLSGGDFDTFGMAYILAVYADSKECIAKYLDFLSISSKEIKGLEKPAGLYHQISDKYKVMTELFPFSGANGSGCTADRNKAPELLQLAKECKALEEEAMAGIEAALEKLG